MPLTEIVGNQKTSSGKKESKAERRKEVWLCCSEVLWWQPCTGDGRKLGAETKRKAEQEKDREWAAPGPPSESWCKFSGEDYASLLVRQGLESSLLLMQPVPVRLSITLFGTTWPICAPSAAQRAWACRTGGKKQSLMTLEQGFGILGNGNDKVTFHIL